MTTIFISGSREIPFLPEEAKDRIDRIIEHGFDVVVGDSEKGVDAKVISYLAEREYPNVAVYTIHEKPRVKAILDFWNVHKVAPEAERKLRADGSTRNARELETSKDEAMGEVADFGLVIWKSSSTNRFGRETVSKGSLRNMHQLLSDGKPVVLYKYEDSIVIDAEFRCIELKALDDLASVVAECDEIVRKAYEALGVQVTKKQRAQKALFDEF